MQIQRLALRDLRQFSELGLLLHPKLTLLKGSNATGKTTLLEAAYLLCRGQSFRAKRTEEVIHHHQSAALITALVDEQGSGLGSAWQVSVKRGEVAVKRFDESITRRQQAETLPAIVLDRQIHRLLEDAPVFRRRFIDWGLFYVEQNFLGHWQRYERALQQRNSSLRSRLNPSAIGAWDQELFTHGTALTELRRQQLSRLSAHAQQWLSVLGQGYTLELEYRPGWDDETRLDHYLQFSIERDQKIGHTLGGPHRAELRLRVDGRDARANFSRGEQKMLALALTLAQGTLVFEATGKRAIILLDDLDAELSKPWQSLVIQALLQYQGQSLVSSLEWQADLAPAGALINRDYTVFHVEHGAVSPK
jgi:DNA replication and repair protein RecF